MSQVKEIETDYLVIGGGAMGAAFADEILRSDKNAHVTIVDQRDRLGGHWVDAYPYVKLHQPSAYYGVNSKILGNGSNDLSSKTEILDYYSEVLCELEATGRCQFLGQHKFLENGTAHSLSNPENTVRFSVRRKTVDATYMGVEVPKTHPPKFDVAEDVPLVPLNDLDTEYGNWDSFYVLGCGKTGIDAILFLLERGVPLEAMTWVMPNEMWCFNRESIQPGSVMDTVDELIGSATHLTSTKDIFLELERRGVVIRLSSSELPTKWKCATVTKDELERLSQLENKIKKRTYCSFTIRQNHFQKR